jgi:hypothetical protein
MRWRYLFPMLFLAVPLCGTAQDSSAAGISFSPEPGMVEPGQSVTVIATGTWSSPPTVFCTTDGSPANIAATLVGSTGSGGGSISVLEGPNQTSETLNCVAALGAVTYQNVNASDTGWKTCIGNLTYASNGTPEATCTGGVGDSYPTSWDFAWGPTMTEQMTGGDNVQILATFGADVCPLCDQPVGTQIMMAQSKTVMATVDSSILSNNEMDMQAVDATNTVGGVPVQHNFGLQCEQSSPAGHPGYWAIDGTGKWVPTTISDQCPWAANTPIEVVAQGWWALGDTGCGGNGCFHVISLTINGTVYDLSSTVWKSDLPAGTLTQPSRAGWSSFFGIQDQMDLASTGGTAGRTVTNANVTEAYYTSNPVRGAATYTTAASARLVAPTPGSPLPGSSVAFTWTPVAGFPVYALCVGSTGPGSIDIYSSGPISTTSVVVTDLPINGKTIYVQLWALANNAWVPSNYTYTAANNEAAAIITPAPDNTLPGSSVTFTWTAPTGASFYDLTLGSTGPGSSDICNSGAISTTSVTVTGMPTNGETIYARLWTFVDDAWVPTNYTFTAATQESAAIVTPAPGSTLTGSMATFSWTAPIGASFYNLTLGSTGPGSSDICNSGAISTNSVLVTGLPTNGETIYARLWTFVDNAWVSTNYTFTAATTATAAIPSSLLGNTLTSPSVISSWTSGRDATFDRSGPGLRPGCATMHRQMLDAYGEDKANANPKGNCRPAR